MFKSDAFKALEYLDKKLERIGNSNSYYFTSPLKVFVLDGDTGLVYSINLKGGSLVQAFGVLSIVNYKNSMNIDLVDVNKCYVNPLMSDACANRFASKGYAFLHIHVGYKRMVPVYVHHIMVLCKEGLEALSVVFDRSSKSVRYVVDHVDQKEFKCNKMSNLEIVTQAENRRRAQVAKYGVEVYENI